MPTVTPLRGLTLPAPAPGVADSASRANLERLVTWSPKSRWDATADPLVTDDGASDYYPGSMWLNVSAMRLFLCASATRGDAQWKQILLPTSVGAVPAGSVADYAGASPPAGWLACDGSPVSRSTYVDLFAAIGTTWGAGNGTTTFNLPDLRGRTAVGAGTGSGLSPRTLAATGGEEEHTLDISEMPAHQHSVDLDSSGGSTSPAQSSFGVSPVSSVGTSTEGGGAAHNNMQPFAVLNKVIKT
jgi:microcystin-dependent protein